MSDTKRDIYREYRNIKTEEENANKRIKSILSSLNEAYADLIAISIDKEELTTLIAVDKATEHFKV